MKPASILLLAVLLILPTIVHSQEAGTANDTANYIEAVDKAKDMTPEEQIILWTTYLEEHPESQFRDEIERNLNSLDELVQETDPQRKKEARDTQLYQRALHFSKKLEPRDQILMWEQFLEDNPDNLFRKEAEGILKSLHVQFPDHKRKTKERDKDTQVVPVVPDLEFKDREHALMLATFPGLVVPGIGHFYAGDYITFGLLAICRAGALGAGVPGVINGNRALIITGAVIYAFTYIVDVGHAPIAVDHYNDKLELKAKEAEKPPVTEIPFLKPQGEPWIALGFSF